MLSEILNAAGLELGTWAMLIFIAFYLFRGARAGKKVGAVLGRAIMYGIAILVAFGLASALGWANLFPGQFIADTINAAGFLFNQVVERLLNFVSI